MQTSPELTYSSFTSSICTTGEYFMANRALQLYLLCSPPPSSPLILSRFLYSMPQDTRPEGKFASIEKKMTMMQQ